VQGLRRDLEVKYLLKTASRRPVSRSGSLRNWWTQEPAPSFGSSDDRHLSGIFSVQDEIVLRIVTSMRVERAYLLQ
jgi:hypothetical protein